jgi:hypothetical protein
MSIGLGIFLSSLCLGTIALYGITKDRWNWRRIGRNISLGLLVIAIAGAGVYFWNDLPTFIPKQNEYAGLRLGMTQEEVQYIKGHPPTVLGEAEGEGEWKGFKPNIATTNLEKGKRVEDRGGPGCLNRFSASISGASARVRLPSGVAAG